MIGSEAVTLIKQRVQRATSATTALDSWIETEIKQAQTRLERMPELPWFLLSEKAFITVTVSEERVIMPANFLRENEDDDMQIFDTDDDSWTELTKSTMDAMRVRFRDEEEGRPRWYDSAGEYFRIRPIPDKGTYRLYMTYFKRGATFDLGLENIWLKYASDLITSEAGIVIATGLRNQGAQTLFEALRASEFKRISDDNVAREMANYDPNPED